MPPHLSPTRMPFPALLRKDHLDTKGLLPPSPQICLPLSSTARSMVLTSPFFPEGEEYPLGLTPPPLLSRPKVPRYFKRLMSSC